MVLITLLFTLILQSVDTLSQAYSNKWTAQQDSVQKAEGLVGLLASHDLAFVVFGVVIIVLSLVFIYLFRLDSKLSKMESTLNLP